MANELYRKQMIEQGMKATTENILLAFLQAKYGNVFAQAALRRIQEETAVQHALTALANARSEYEMACARLAMATAVRVAIEGNPQVALQLGLAQLANGGQLGGFGGFGQATTSPAPPSQIGSAAAGVEAERQEFRRLKTEDDF